MFLSKKYFLLVVVVCVLLFTVNILAAINDDLEELNVKEFVDREVSGHSITVFSKSYCPYCRRCITLLKKLNISDLRVIQLDEMAEGAEIQDELMKRTGRRTVPSVWIAKQFIGGSDDVHHAHREGRLQKLLQEKGISFTDFKDEL